MDATKRQVLLTGSAGRIGTAFRERYGDRYRFRLVDIRETESPAGHEVVTGDLAELDFAREICRGVDTVIHLAADPSPRAGFYESLLRTNFQATYNVFHAAHEAGCRRVVFASSIHAVNAYPLDVQIRPEGPIRPGDLYGVSKCFGEALCAYYAYRCGMSCLPIRIGAFATPERVAESDDSRFLTLFVSHDDLCQLIHCCVEAPDSLRFEIFQGVSDNQLKRMDISNARELIGYAPRDNAFQLSARTDLKPRRPDEPDV